MDEKKTNWETIEKYFATEVIEQSKKGVRRWFIAWAITFAALIFTNAAWIYVFNSYEYVYQDGSGQNNYNNNIDGDVENVTTN